MILVFVLVWFASFDVIRAILELSVPNRMFRPAHCQYGYLSSIILILHSALCRWNRPRVIGQWSLPSDTSRHGYAAVAATRSPHSFARCYNAQWVQSGHLELVLTQELRGAQPSLYSLQTAPLYQYRT